MTHCQYCETTFRRLHWRKLFSARFAIEFLECKITFCPKTFKREEIDTCENANIARKHFDIIEHWKTLKFNIGEKPHVYAREPFGTNPQIKQTKNWHLLGQTSSNSQTITSKSENWSWNWIYDYCADEPKGKCERCGKIQLWKLQQGITLYLVPPPPYEKFMQGCFEKTLTKPHSCRHHTAFKLLFWRWWGIACI